MKTIGVFFNAPGFNDYPFDDEEYRRSYHQFGSMLADANACLTLVRGQDTYDGASAFRGGWTFRDGTFVRTEDRLPLDVILNKGNLVADHAANVVNVPELESLCTDKSRTYARFTEWSPKTVTLRSAGDLPSALTTLKTAILVAKPLDQEGGHGVRIVRREEIPSVVTTFPYLLQEFIDTSGGIPTIASGMHDLRIISVEGKIVLSYLREPKAGSFLANESQGGKLSEVELHRLPEDALDIWKIVDEEVKQYSNRVYSLDIGRDREHGWRIIELNSKPGLDPIGKYPGAERFMRSLADLLLSA